MKLKKTKPLLLLLLADVLVRRGFRGVPVGVLSLFLLKGWKTCLNLLWRNLTWGGVSGLVLFLFAECFWSTSFL